MVMVHVEGEDRGKIVLYALSTCVWCKKTKELLKDLGVAFNYVFVDQLEGIEQDKALEEIKRYNVRCSFPTTIIDDEKCVVGYKEREIKEALGL
jgi:glutaredoxin-like protein NrdH